MIGYQNKYQVKKPIAVVFEYFLKKDYLCKGYSKKRLKNSSMRASIKGTYLQQKEIIIIREKSGDYFHELEYHIEN